MNWKTQQMGTTSPPLQSHIAHLRHISRIPSTVNLLRKRYGYSKSESEKRSTVVCSHIEQALHFYQSYSISPPEVAPVSLYYCYLNLAVAVTEAYRNTNDRLMHTHGLSDKTSTLNQVGLRSVVLQSSRGAVPQFHSLISSVNIKNKKLTLLDLFINFPHVHGELSSAFKENAKNILVLPGIDIDKKQTPHVYSSKVQIQVDNPHRGGVLQSRTVKKLFPHLLDDFHYSHGKKERKIYKSKTTFTGTDAFKKSSELTAEQYLKLSNFGYHADVSDLHKRYWHYTSGTIFLPALTTTLMIAFVGASIARYRPRLLTGLNSSRYNLLFDVFYAESPGLMLPAMRNLLYRELVQAGQTRFL